MENLTDEQRDALVRLLARVSAGAPLSVAAKNEGSDLGAVLEIALAEPTFATALLVAQNERISWSLEDIRRAVDDVVSATQEVACNMP